MPEAAPRSRVTGDPGSQYGDTHSSGYRPLASAAAMPGSGGSERTGYRASGEVHGPGKPQIPGSGGNIPGSGGSPAKVSYRPLAYTRTARRRRSADHGLFLYLHLSFSECESGRLAASCAKRDSLTPIRPVSGLTGPQYAGLFTLRPSRQDKWAILPSTSDTRCTTILVTYLIPGSGGRVRGLGGHFPRGPVSGSAPYRAPGEKCTGPAGKYTGPRGKEYRALGEILPGFGGNIHPVFAANKGFLRKVSVLWFAPC